MSSFQGIIITPTTPVMRPPVRKEMRRGFRLEKSFEGETTLAATLVFSVAMSSAMRAMNATDGLIEFAEEGDRVPDGFAEEDCRRGGNGDSDERVERHGEGKAQGLSHGLRTLGFRIAGEVGDVEGDGGPEADHAGERGDEEPDELGGVVELAGSAQDGAEASGFAGDPPEEQQADRKHEGRADAFEELDGVRCRGR